MRPPILIIGAHRSGTSATAHALEILGLQIGERLDSHREPRPLQRLHDDYLKHLGAAWHDPTPFLEAMQTPRGEQHCTDYLRESVDFRFAHTFDYRKNPKGLWRLARLKLGASWGWKEPRTTLFAPAWKKIFPEARFIHVLRDDHAAARSIRERELKFQAAGDTPTGRTADLDYCLELVRTYVEAGQRMAGSSDYRAVQFEHLQTHPEKTLLALAQFCHLPAMPSRLTKAAATIRPPTVRPAV